MCKTHQLAHCLELQNKKERRRMLEMKGKKRGSLDYRKDSTNPKTCFSSAFNSLNSEKAPFPFSSPKVDNKLRTEYPPNTHIHPDSHSSPYLQFLGRCCLLEDSPRSSRTVSSHMLDLPAAAAGQWRHADAGWEKQQRDKVTSADPGVLGALLLLPVIPSF